MMKTDDGKVWFVLPRFRSDREASGLFSFHKASVTVAGFFVPGREPIIFDPIHTANDTPLATINHEQVHQDMMANTSFGIFHQILHFVSKETGRLHDECLLSMEEQWSVQELNATYTEMMFVAVLSPQLLQKAVSRLPSAILDEPPYREIFDSVARYLPIDSRIPTPRIIAQQVFVNCAALWAMSNDCLDRFPNPSAFQNGGFRAYLSEESPHRRFERLMSKVLLQDQREALLKRVESDTSVDRDPISWLIPEFAAITGTRELVWNPLQIQTVADAWYEEAGLNVTHQPPFPLVSLLAEPQQYAAESAQFEAKATLTTESLRATLADLKSSGVGVFFGLSSDGKSTRIHLGTYLRGDTAEPRKREPGEIFQQLDLFGVLPFGEVCQTLDEAQPSPHIFIFRGVEAWDFWRDWPERKNDALSSIWVCSERLVTSLDRTRETLRFRNLGHSGYYCVLRSSQGDSRYGAFVGNLAVPDSYALFFVSSEDGVRLFEGIAESIGLAKVTDQSNLNMDLMSMIFEVERM